MMVATDPPTAAAMPNTDAGDAVMAYALLRLDVAALSKDPWTLGQLLESFVYHELRRQASWHGSAITSHRYRGKDGTEVDVVLIFKTKGVTNFKTV